MIASRSSAPCSPPAIDGRRLIMSTVGVTPPGVATTISWPASVSSLSGFANSSAQYPVAYLVPSFSTRYVAPVITKSTLAMPNNTPLCPSEKFRRSTFNPKHASSIAPSAPCPPGAMDRSRDAHGPFEMMNLVFDLRQEEGPLGLVGGQRQRLPVGAGRLVGPAEPGQQVGPDRVQILVAGQSAVGVEPLDLGQRRLRAVGHRQRHGAVQRDDRRRPHREQPVVQLDELRPVGLVVGRRLGVEGGDR